MRFQLQNKLLAPHRPDVQHLHLIHCCPLLELPLSVYTEVQDGLKRHLLQDRDAEEGDEQWSLSRFAPLMQEVLEDLATNKLNFDEYPYVQPPTETGNMGSCHVTTHMLHLFRAWAQSLNPLKCTPMYSADLQVYTGYLKILHDIVIQVASSHATALGLLVPCQLQWHGGKAPAHCCPSQSNAACTVMYTAKIVCTVMYTEKIAVMLDKTHLY